MKIYALFILIAISIHLFSPETACQITTRSAVADTITKINTNYEAHHNGVFLLTLSKPLKKQEIRSLGFQIVQQLDSLKYMISLPQDKSLSQLKSSRFSITPADNLWKLAPNVIRGYVNPGETGKFIIRVKDITAFENDRVKSVLPLKEISVDKASNSLMIETSVQTIFNQIAGLENVLFVEKVSGVPKEENEIIDFNSGVNKINKIHQAFPAINGSGITVSIKENKYDTADVDLIGRHIPDLLSGPFVTRHATEMATIIAGGGNSSFKGKGVAWGANMTSSYFIRLLPDDDRYYQKLHISVQNNSYGTAIENFYGILANAYDVCTLQHPDLLQVFSVGNSGQLGDTVSGVYKGIGGFANITGNSKQAKNIITVGSVNEQYQADPNVSRGPAFDGRVKPELVSYSTFGSSNSAALVSGIAILLQQAYKISQGNNLPPAALLKAILINSADDVGPEGIDYITGYGNVNAFRAFTALSKNQFFSSTMHQNEEKFFELSIPADVVNLKITLVWNDAAATPNAFKALVNDLDLELLQTSTGKTWKPWVLNSYPNKDSLLQKPVRKADRLNNVEQISIPDPSNGSYTVKVSAFDLPVSPQDFFIAYQWDDKYSFTWTFPTVSDNFQNTDGLHTFRWESTFADSEKGTLDVSFNGGNTWQTISNNVNLHVGYFTWTPPAMDSPAIARMNIQGRTFLTDTFVISNPLALKVGFNCADSVMLQWDKIRNVTSYTLFSLGSVYMDPVLTTSDTAVIIKKSHFPSTLFAVQPHFNDNLPGQRSAAYDYQLQGVDCYFKSFLAQNMGVSGIKLLLELGSTYAVAGISFEKWNNQAFETLETVLPSNNLNFNYLHTNPQQGYNVYRVSIFLNNGKVIQSSLDTVFYLTQAVARVFPNPVRQYETLKVYIQFDTGGSAIFTLFDLNGRTLIAKNLYSDQEDVALDRIPPGMYIYQIQTKAGVSGGKVFVY